MGLTGKAHEGSLQGDGNVLNRGLGSVQLSSVAQSCPTLCDPMNCSMPGLSVHQHFLSVQHIIIHYRFNVLKKN